MVPLEHVLEIDIHLLEPHVREDLHGGAALLEALSSICRSSSSPARSISRTLPALCGSWALFPPCGFLRLAVAVGLGPGGTSKFDQPLF